MRFVVLLSLCWCVFAARPSWALPTLMDVRVGPHKRFDRVVFEFQGEVANRLVTRLNQKVEVRFSDVAVRPGLSLPRLPMGLSVLAGLSMEMRGTTGVVFTLALGRDAVPSELTLAGESWRLAIDLAPRVVETHEEKPEYIPGDLPIPTNFGEAVNPADTLPNSTQAPAILAYYYLAQKDTPEALRQAETYRELTGERLDLGIVTEPAAPTARDPKTPYEAPSKTRWIPLHANAPRLAWMWLAIAFAAGFAVGIYAMRYNRTLKLPGFRFSLRRAPKSAKALATEMEENLATLKEAVGKESKRPAAPTPSFKEAPAAQASPAPPPPEPVVVEEDEVRESLMDKRVKRVLELAREGRNVAEIAEELEMGQDEVRLILDLNQ